VLDELKYFLQMPTFAIDCQQMPTTMSIVMTTHTTSKVIKLRNKLTGLYYADGRCFTASEDSATPVQANSVSHRFIRLVFGADKFDAIEEVAA
jgi:hypothetical protein